MKLKLTTILIAAFFLFTNKAVALGRLGSNVDKWVSEDGKHISFVGTVGNKWYPIIYNNKANLFWTPNQAPQYAGNGNKWAYSMWWSKKEGYKLWEQGKATVQSSKLIQGTQYSSGGKLLYASKPNATEGLYIYLNHKQIDGPFKQVANNGLGFIPNTETVYYNTFSKVKLGNKEYVCKENETVNGFKVSENVISFVVLNRKNRKNSIYEYDIKTGELKSHGTYNGYVQINKFDKSLYYVNNDIKNSQYFVIASGGNVLWEKQNGKNSGARMSPNGNLYVWYKQNGIFKILKNGKSIPFNGKIASIEPITFNHASDEAVIHAKIDKTVSGKNHHIYYGNLNFDVSGDLNAGKLYPTDDGKSLFYTVRTIQDKIWTYKLYKNGQTINNNAYAEIGTFAATPSGNKYAMLITNKQTKYYMILNEQMDANWKLVFNGKELPGKYGAPVWSKKHNAIIALKQVGRNIVIEKLD